MRRLLVLLAAAGVLATANAGCGGDGDAGPAPEELVRESAEATGALESFHFTYDSEGVPRSAGGLQLLGAEGDAVVPHRVRADVTGTFAGFPLSTQLVSVDRDIWFRDPLEGGWRTIDVETTPGFLLDPTRGVLGVMQRVEELENEGVEEISGTEAWRLRGSIAAADVAPLFAVEPADGEVEVTLWIGEDDRVLRRIEVAGAVAEGEPDEATRSVELSRLDEPVSIEPPEDAP